MMRRIGIDGETALGVDTSKYILLDARGRIACQLEYPRVMTAWARLYGRSRTHSRRSTIIRLNLLLPQSRTSMASRRFLPTAQGQGAICWSPPMARVPRSGRSSFPTSSPLMRATSPGAGSPPRRMSSPTARSCSRATRSVFPAANSRCLTRCRRATAISGRAGATTISSGIGRRTRRRSPTSTPMRPGAATSRFRRR